MAGTRNDPSPPLTRAVRQGRLLFAARSAAVLEAAALGDAHIASVLRPSRREEIRKHRCPPCLKMVFLARMWVVCLSRGAAAEPKRVCLGREVQVMRRVALLEHTRDGGNTCGRAPSESGFRRSRRLLALGARVVFSLSLSRGMCFFLLQNTFVQKRVTSAQKK